MKLFGRIIILNEMDRPLSWEQLQILIQNPETKVLKRQEVHHQKLIEHLENVKASGLTIDQYISETILTSDLVLTENKFPYWVKDNIQHLILWSKTEKTHEEIEAYLRSIFTEEFEYCWFRNNPNNRTVKTIFHVQVFVRRT